VCKVFVDVLSLLFAAFVLLQDKLLRELDASLIVADVQTTLWLVGKGDISMTCSHVLPYSSCLPSPGQAAA
jgi:ATP-dependent protease HslVU (ClpYQ) peptidase subunit